MRRLLAAVVVVVLVVVVVRAIGVWDALTMESKEESR